MAAAAAAAASSSSGRKLAQFDFGDDGNGFNNPSGSSAAGAGSSNSGNGFNNGGNFSGNHSEPLRLLPSSILAILGTNYPHTVEYSTY